MPLRLVPQPQTQTGQLGSNAAAAIFDNCFSDNFFPMKDSLELIRDFLQERLEIEPQRVEPETRLDALGVDSLLLLELMFELEEHFNVNLPTDLPMPETVAQMVAQADQLRAQQQGS